MAKKTPTMPPRPPRPGQTLAGQTFAGQTLAGQTIMAPQPPRYGLFRRILIAFFLAVIAFAGIAAATAWMLSSRFDHEWVERVEDTVHEHADALIPVRRDPEAAGRILAEIERKLDVRMSLHARGGKLLAGSPHPPPHHHPKRMFRRLRHGSSVVLPRAPGIPPVVLLGLIDKSSQKMVAVVTIDPGNPNTARLQMAGFGFLFLLLIGLAAYLVSRSLTGRLAVLKEGAGQIAAGDLDHRIDLDRPVPRDEIDDLATAFNHMARRLKALLRGQRTLLANVSHELRTPVARMRVLVEILEDQVNAGGGENPAGQRVLKGLGELTEDLTEMETLIRDLLTSGKLELAADGNVSPLDLHRVEVEDVVRRVAGRQRATLHCETGVEVDADAMLLERLFANLLSNARRACPEGALDIHVTRHPDHIELAVEDEGHGIDPDSRESIFEPFSRLDKARARDQGGVGLGLHLCRQIARAHGGTLHAEDRPDGKQGARLVLRLPLPA
ncbi:MAG: HAMP domain-containing sensor histidine kinase [Nannocystaceae bacterium]